ncbi:MAG: site-specific integrase [Tepidisphaera sp.]
MPSRRSKGQGSVFRRSGAGPYIATWVDHSGKRCQKSTQTTDKATALRILGKFVADAALRREGVIDAAADRYAVQGRIPFETHAEQYLANCERRGLDAEHIASKRKHLTGFREVSKIELLYAVTPDTLETYLASVKDAGRSARSVNFARQQLVAFAGWCVKTGRLLGNPFKSVSIQDESQDRRRVRRPLTDDELGRLVQVASDRGRAAWYLGAALAGLRRGDLKRIEWRDVNLTEKTLTIRNGKAKRTDVLSMHPQLVQAFRDHLKAHPGVPTARVFREAVTNRTRLSDFLRAGIARRVPILGADGKPVRIGKGKRERDKTRIDCTDAEGRIADLHALRTTLGTQLARAGVAPQVAQKIMRHSDYRTTLKSYTVLGLHDTATAVAKLPSIRTPGREEQRATGTHGQPQAVVVNPQLESQLIRRDSMQIGATRRTDPTSVPHPSRSDSALENRAISSHSDAPSGMERKRLELSTPSLQS